MFRVVRKTLDRTRLGRQYSNQELRDYVFSTKYARAVPAGNATSRFETWGECVDRVIGMYKTKYYNFPEVIAHLEEVRPLMLAKKILPSGRVLQFAGPAIAVNNMKGYNCSYLPAKHPKFFKELFYLLLCGTGAGFSNRLTHILQLPVVRFSTEKQRFVIPDTIEGWAESMGKLVDAAYGLGPMPVFDFSQIRKKGSPLITSGGLAPGPDPLMVALREVEVLFRKKEGEKLDSLDVLDISTTISNAVVSGGVRRSSLICLFDRTDKAMLGAKMGEWWKTHPHRALCNNSAVFKPSEKSEVASFFDNNPSVFEFGEPGIVFKNSDNSGTNPCAEAGLEEYQCCNLSDLIMGAVSPAEFPKVARAAAFLGTLYAGFTDFPFLSEDWKTSMQKDALIGVSLNGVAAVDYKAYDLKYGAMSVVEENWYWSQVIGINNAARNTLVKPGGTTSLLTGVPAGIHASYAQFAVRRVIEPMNTPTAKYFMENFADAVEPHLTNPLNVVIKFPYAAPPGAKTRHEPIEEMLERIAHVQENWVLPGWTSGADSHSVSATVNFVHDDIPKLKSWVSENSSLLGGVSFIQHHPNLVYKQAPFTEVEQKEYDELCKTVEGVDFSQIHGKDLSREIESQCTSGLCEVRHNEKFSKATV